jgi:hypothetical protein
MTVLDDLLAASTTPAVQLGAVRTEPVGCLHGRECDYANRVDRSSTDREDSPPARGVGLHGHLSQLTIPPIIWRSPAASADGRVRGRIFPIEGV